MADLQKHRPTIGRATLAAAGIAVPGAFVGALDVTAMAGIWTKMMLDIARDSGHPVDRDYATLVQSPEKPRPHRLERYRGAAAVGPARSAAGSSASDQRAARRRGAALLRRRAGAVRSDRHRSACQAASLPWPSKCPVSAPRTPAGVESLSRGRYFQEALA